MSQVPSYRWSLSVRPTNLCSFDTCQNRLALLLLVPVALSAALSGWSVALAAACGGFQALCHCHPVAGLTGPVEQAGGWWPIKVSPHMLTRQQLAPQYSSASSSASSAPL